MGVRKIPDRRGSLTSSAGEVAGRGAAFPHRHGAGAVESQVDLASPADPRSTRTTILARRTHRSSVAAPARVGRRPSTPDDQRSTSFSGAGRLSLVTALDFQPPSEASDSPICPHGLSESGPHGRAKNAGLVHAAVVPPRRLRNGSRASPAPGHARSAATATPSVDPAETPHVARSRGLNGRLEGRGGRGRAAGAEGRPSRSGLSRGARPRGAGCRRSPPCNRGTVGRIFRHALNGYRGLQHPNLRFDLGASARRHSW